MGIEFLIGLSSGAAFGAGFMWLLKLPPHAPRALHAPAMQTKPLLQLVARHMDNWPAGFGRVIQFECGTVWACAGYGTGIELFRLTEIAGDRATAVVTEFKWKAERAKVLKEQA
jgi:hypothetical protein